MPIRFACPHCHQRLSVSTRKAGTAAQCPRCHATVTIPLAANEPEAEGANQSDSVAGSFLVGEPMVAEPLVAEPLVAEPQALPAIEPPPRADEAQTPQPPIAVATSAVSTPPIPGTMSRGNDVAAQPAVNDFVVVPRLVIYAQGGLLTVVAVTSLIIGVMLGRTFAPRPVSNGDSRECHVSGNVTYTTAARTRPDRGAVVVLIPLLADAAGERASVAGLRPSDPPPPTDHPGLGVIRQLGGSYLRADPNGRFEVRAPAGHYWLLIISHHKRAGAAASAGDVRLLGRYFENAADLLENREYRLTREEIVGDVQWTADFHD